MIVGAGALESLRRKLVVAQMGMESKAFLQLPQIVLVLLCQLDRIDGFMHHLLVTRSSTFGLIIVLFLSILLAKLLLKLRIILSLASQIFLFLQPSSLSLLLAPAHFILLASLFEGLQTIQVLHSYKLLIEVLTLEFIIGAKSKDALLLELAHKDLLHLPMCQFSIVVESESLHPSLFIFFQLNFVFNDLHACLEDTLVFDSLTNLDLARASAL